MDNSHLQNLAASPPSLHPTPLQSLADDASHLAAQQPPSPGLDSQSFQPLHSAIGNIGQHHHHDNYHHDIQNNTGNASTSPATAFVRRRRPGEQVNTLLISSPEQRTQDEQPQQRRRLSNSRSFEPREISHDCDEYGKTEVSASENLDNNANIDITRPATTTTHSCNLLQTRDSDPEILQPPEQYQQREPDFALPIDSAASAGKSDGCFKGTKLVIDPPDLEAWRERLFNVDEMITLSGEQFLTYFPHVDNVYSHRSTQRYKRKPFVSYYWDCRLKGRPPGTPKSNDPNKKKRKRTARQRDLCDVKIKITEYFPGFHMGTPPELAAFDHPSSSSSSLLQGVGVGGVNDVHIDGSGSGGDHNDNNHVLFNNNSVDSTTTSATTLGENQPFGVLTPNITLPEGHPGANGDRYFTIQRVNGNGGNGKNEGIGGGHRHTLEESDRVKKNSVQRYLLKEAKEKKRAITQQQQKTYHTKATGLAAVTAKDHSKEAELKLYGSCFCPFVQRVWIALELKGIPYEYIEVDPYQKPQSLLEVNPRGLVPALRHGDWGCYESTVLLEYLEDIQVGPPLLPPGDAKLRAHCRLWADHINRHIVPGFYRVLQEQVQDKQISHAQELRNDFEKLVNAAHPQGPFFLGPTMSLVDVQIAPWIIRLGRVLTPYRGWPDPEPGSRWAAWVDAIEADEHVKATTSSDELYLDSYKRYAQNRPNTSQVANAINSGRGLP